MPAKNTMAKFDSYSESYRELVTQSVRISGESFEYFAAYKARYISHYFAGAKIDRVLDYGCGVGALAEQLKLQIPGARIDGFDPSQDSLDCLAPLLRDQGTFSNELDSIGADYSLIVIANVLHHVVPRKRENVFCKIFSKLAPGGRAVIFEHNPLNPLTRWAVSQCPFDGNAVLLGNSEVRDLLAGAGFQELKRDFVVFFPRWLAAFRPFERFLGWLPLGAQYAFSGIRPTS